jgi:peptide chain release factor subunit 1
MYEPEVKIGVVLVSGSTCQIYVVSKTGSYTEHTRVKNMDIDLQKRQKKGGQSAQRIGRIRDGKEAQFINYVAESIVDLYMMDNNTKYLCDKIIIGGSSTIKNKVIEVPIFQQYFKGRVLRVMDLEIRDNTIFEVIDSNIDLINESCNQECDKYVEEIVELIAQASDKLVFGYERIYKNLMNCTLEAVYVDCNLDPAILNKIDELNTYGVKVLKCGIMDNVHIDCAGVKFY